MDSVGKELQRLADLLEGGHLSQEEYQSLKDRLIGSFEVDEAPSVKEEKAKPPSEPLSQQPVHASGLTGEEIPTASYSIRGLGLTICWLSGIALIPLGIAIGFAFQGAALMTDLIDRPTLVHRSGFLSEWELADDAYEVAGGLAILLGLVAFVLLVIWSWRATKNLQAWAHHFGHKKLRRRPGWAIGGWFIPIGFLWIPYQTIKDAWERAPFIDGAGQRINVSTPNRTWLVAWLTWLFTTPLINQVGLGLLSDETPRDFRTAYYLDGISNIVFAVSVICFIITVKKISDRHAGS